MEELIGRFLTTYIHSRINGKSDAEVLMGRSVRTINHAMRPTATFIKKRSSFKLVFFNADDPVLANDFWPRQTWITSLLLNDVGGLYMKIR